MTKQIVKLHKMKNQKGITLIALIITIIVLLILAGISISLIVGDNGVLKKSQEAEKQKIEEYREKLGLSNIAAFSKKLENVMLEDLKEQIYEDGVVEEGTIIDIDDTHAKVITPEGYIFLISVKEIKYVGKNDNMEKAHVDAIVGGNILVDIENKTEWKKSKNVTMSTTERDLYIYYSYDNNTWTKYKSSLTLIENKKIYVKLCNIFGLTDGKSDNFDVEYIDNEAPVISEVSSNATTIKFTATDNLSGIVGYLVTTSKTQEEIAQKNEQYIEITKTNQILDKEVTDINQNTTYYIWVKDFLGNVSSYSTATGKIAVSSIDIIAPGNTTSMYVGDEQCIIALVMPTNAFEKNIIWSSKDTSIAEVKEINGNITIKAKKAGTTKINATCGGVTEIIDVTVNVRSITFGPSDSLYMYLGNEKEVYGVSSPESTNKIIWTSNDTNIVEIVGSSYVKNGKEYIKIKAKGIGTTTIKAECDGGTKIVNVEVGQLNIGDNYVGFSKDKYSVNVGGKTINNWRIFLIDSDGKGVHIITSDVVENTAITTGTNSIASKTGLSAGSNSYNLLWNSAPSSQINSLDSIFRNNLNSAYDNSKCVSTLLNKNNWTAFKQANSGAQYAIGSPTLEMWVNSWNTKTASDAQRAKITFSTNSYGYSLGLDSTVSTISNIGYNIYDLDNSLRNTKQWDSNNKGGLYFIHDGDGGWNNCHGYYLASPSGKNNVAGVTGGDSICMVGFNGFFGGSNKSINGDYFGIRPVVYIKLSDD